MRKVRVVFGSDDGEKVKNSHMGDSPRFYLYDIFENGEFEFVEKRENSVKDMEHAGDGKLMKISDILKDAEVLVAMRKSPNFKKIASKLKFLPVVIGRNDIKEVIKIISGEFENIFTKVTERKNGVLNNSIFEIISGGSSEK